MKFVWDCLSCFKMTLASFWNRMKQFQTNLALIIWQSILHMTVLRWCDAVVYSECRRFLLRLPFHAQKKPWGEIEKSCSHTFGCHNLFSCERQHAVSLFSSTELSFYQDFAHHMAMQFLVSNFSSYNISYQYLIFICSLLSFFVKNLCRCFSSEFCLHSCSSVSFPGIKY